MPYLQRVYGLFDASESVQNAHLAAEGHDFGLSKRRALYGFFARHLALERGVAIDEQGKLRENKVSILPYEDLLVFDVAHPRPASFAPPVSGGDSRAR
jgi:hypothetical protein